MTAAIYYHPEAYSTDGPKLMGRNAAGESFLRGFLSHGTAAEIWLQVEDPGAAEHFGRAFAGAGRSRPIKVVQRGALGALAQPGTVYYPGPDLGGQAWRRAAFGAGAWSLCGITHTTASAGAMEALANLLVAPVQPWDALICTSHAVRENVRQVLQAQADHLVERLGARQLVLPQLPVIPLGIHAADFEFTAAERAGARAALGAGAGTHVLLFSGRLSFHAKAHPLAMYQAAEVVARGLPRGESILLVECGWHANASIAAAYAEAARQACPSVKVETLDGRVAAARRQAWAAADVFCSLSDNIQETFGLVPIEAMAAGLPALVSDWDGYKDTVRDGVDGMRVPTLMPGAGLGADLALRHALEVDTYDLYCGHASSFVAVEVGGVARALARLLASA